MTPVALTIGDPNGIGPEIAIKAAAALMQEGEIAPILVGDPDVIAHYAKELAPDRTCVAFGAAPKSGAFNVFPAGELAPGGLRPGVIAPEAGRATVEAFTAAVDLARSGRVRAVVACPHSETAVNAAGIAFAGYPGLLARLLGVPESSIFLMLVGGGLRIVHATLHERLADALARLTPDLVVAAVTAAAETLRTMGVAEPRIGLFGINPHAGEGGLFGDDDALVTEPAARLLRERGVNVAGPRGADVFLAEPDCDAYVAMFHDQGHIPIKLLAPRGAAAMSIGGGVLLSSVGHGAAFDIAGQGVADPQAVMRALRLVSGLPGLKEGAKK